MVVLDLDGTLLRSDKSLSGYSVKVLKACREAGILVVFATARSEKSSERMTAAIHPDAIISNGGALARRGEEILYRRVIPQLVADSILAACWEHPGVAHITAECDSGYFTSFGDTSTAPQDYTHGIYSDFSGGLGEDCYKIVVEIPRRGDMQELAGRFPEVGFLAFSDEPWGRFAHPMASKWHALEAMAKRLGVETSEIAAFGDDWIDLDMVAKSGIGVAVSNAIPEVKAVAVYICGSNDDDGVAKWLEENVL
jgi:Cof subfamily protein (haloacid dehalogenase superfamily)